MMDCHKIIEALGKGTVLPERTIRELCRKFTETLVSESNLMHIDGPVNIIGDVHGQFYDVQKIFRLGIFIIKQGANCRTASTCFWETTWTGVTTPWKLLYYWPAIKYYIPIGFICSGVITNHGMPPDI
jgi:hypothetical protein